MGARSGEQFLQGLRGTKRQLWLEGERVDDVTAHPALAGAAQTLAGVFDRLLAFPDECLIAGSRDRRAAQHRAPDPALGRRSQAAQPGSGAHRRGHRRPHGSHARLHEREVRQLRRALEGLARRRRAQRGRRAQPRRASRSGSPGEDISLTHTIIHPTIDKSTDAQIVGNRVPLHKVAETQAGIVVRGARILATLAPFADEIAVYPAHPLPAGAEAYALAFSIPVDTPGTALHVPRQRVHARRAGVRPAAVDPLRRAGRLRHLRRRRDPARRDCSSTGASTSTTPSGTTGLRDNMTNQTTIRALTKLEFAYGLATRMAEAIGDASPATQEMLGELLDYVEVTPQRGPALRRARPGRGRRGVVPRRASPRAHALAAGHVVSRG